MGWKSTVTITRKEAIQLIVNRLDESIYEKMSNEDLADMVESLGYGDEVGLAYYGANFLVEDNK
jgi:hypothetical protein